MVRNKLDSVVWAERMFGRGCVMIATTKNCTITDFAGEYLHANQKLGWGYISIHASAMAPGCHFSPFKFALKYSSIC